MNECRPNLVDLPVLAHRVAQLVLVDFVRLGFPLGRERALGEHQNEVVGPVGRRAMHRLQITVAAVDRQRMEQRTVPPYKLYVWPHPPPPSAWRCISDRAWTRTAICWP